MSHVHTPDCYANGCRFGGAMAARRPMRVPLGQLDPARVTVEFQKLQAENKRLQDANALLHHDRILQAQEIERLRGERDRYHYALVRLSRLGNGYEPGNSDGNLIAQDALKEGKDE